MHKNVSTYVPKSSAKSMKSSHIKAQEANSTLLEKLKVNRRSSFEHFWIKIFKTFHEILLTVCYILPCRKKGQGQPKVTI